MSNETQQETWNATHAQLLKSVADAQAKLLAAQNETNDRLEDLKVLLAQTQEAVRNSHGSLSGRLNDLQPRVPAPRARQSRIAKPPQRKQRR